MTIYSLGNIYSRLAVEISVSKVVICRRLNDSTSERRHEIGGLPARTWEQIGAEYPQGQNLGRVGEYAIHATERGLPT